MAITSSPAPTSLTTRWNERRYDLRSALRNLPRAVRLGWQTHRLSTVDKIALLMSHRFSAVRMADRIAVVEDGQLIELGTHTELLAQDGTYARLFNLQATHYR